MIKLIAVETKQGYEIPLRFSDGVFGTFDFTPFIEVGTEAAARRRQVAP